MVVGVDGKFRLAIVGMALVALFGTIFFFGSFSQTNSQTGLIVGTAVQNVQVKTGYLQITASLPLFVALEKGFFKDEGIEISAIPFESSNPIMDAISKGDLDFSPAVSWETLFAVEQRAPGAFKTIAHNFEDDAHPVSALIVKKDRGIAKTTDLEGKTLLTGPGASGKGTAELFLKNSGVDPAKVNLVQVIYSQVVPAFAAGGVDAVLIWEPASTVIVENGLGGVLVETPRSKIFQPFPTSAAVVSSKLAREQPGVARKIQNAILKAADFMEKNPEESKLILAKYLKLDVAIAQKTHLYDNKHAAESIRPVQKLADLSKELGILEKTIDVSQLVFK